MSATFLIPRLGTGFALSMMPIAAQTTITTGAEGITASEVMIPVPDGEIPAYRAIPREGSKLPIVLVVQEIFGVHEHIKDLCRRLAKSGYLAVAPALYARQGDTTAIPDIADVLKIVAKVPDSQVMADLDSTVAWAEKNNGDGAKLAITGFCWGGRIVWLYAAHSTKLKAGAAWYGRLAGATTELQPKNPVDIAQDLQAPVLGLYGGADPGIPLDTIEKMRAAVKAAKGTSVIHVYPDAGHGFNADYRPSYNPEAAKDAWTKMLAWFAKYGVA